MMPLFTLGFNLLVELRLVLPLMLKRALMVVCTTLLIASMHTQADPLSALQATSNLLHVTSLADMIAKAATTGSDTRTLKTVPRLVVMVDCGDCKLSNATKMVITSAYNELAKTSGMVIDAKQPIIFNVTSLFARNSFLRGTFGILSGADHISGQLEGAANQTIGEFSVAHEMGFDEIAELLGEDILKAVITNHIHAAEIKP